MGKLKDLLSPGGRSRCRGACTCGKRCVHDVNHSGRHTCGKRGTH